MRTLAKSIEMISWTDELGKVHPLKFKIEDKTGQRQVYKILRTYHTDPDKVAGNKILKFTCEIDVNGHAKICELRYDLESCRWCLFKI